MSTIPSPQGQPASPLQDPTKGHLQVPANGPYSNPASHSGSDVSLHRIKNLPGYTTPVFKGKEEQRAKVQENIASKVRVSLIPLACPKCGTEYFLTTR
jgi:glutamate dehydrogenase